MKDIEALLKSHKNLIEAEASKYAKFIPLTFVQVEAYRLAREAANKFDPTMGIKFSTFLTNSLQKLSRLSTQYGASVRIPENKQFKISRLNELEAGIAGDLGRAPTVSELADATGMPLAAVNSLLKARKKEVNLANLVYMPIFFEGNDDDWVHFVYHDLSEKDKFIFEHKIGYGNKPVLDNATIAAKLNISPSTVSQRIKLITEKIAEGLTN